MPYSMIDAKIFDSEVMMHGKDVVYVLIGMTALADKTHICSFARHALAGRLYITLDELDGALEILNRPDPDNRSQEWNGRRIVPLKEIDHVESNLGWLVVNREKYIKDIKRDSRNVAQRNFMREIRASEIKGN